MKDNELQHYGVPGMKWGVRKIAKYGVAAAAIGFVGARAMSRKAARGERKVDRLLKKNGKEKLINKEQQKIKGRNISSVILKAIGIAGMATAIGARAYSKYKK